MSFFSTIIVPRDPNLFAWKLAEEYLNVSGTSYEVTSIKKSKSTVVKQEFPCEKNWVTTSAKIATYLLIFPFAIALLTRTVYRHVYHIQVVDPKIEEQKLIDGLRKEVFPQEVVSPLDKESLTEIFRWRDAFKRGLEQSDSLCNHDELQAPVDFASLDSLLTQDGLETRRSTLNRTIASALQGLLDHPDSSEALATAKAVRKKVSTFLRTKIDTDKWMNWYKAYLNPGPHSESFLKGGSWACPAAYLLQQDSSPQANVEYATMWYLLKRLKRQTKLISKKRQFWIRKDLKPLLQLTWLHGTKASVLQAASEQTDKKLIPTGELRDRGIVPLAGEMYDGAVAHGINRAKLSGTSLLQGNMAKKYAKSYLFNIQSEVSNYRSLFNPNATFSLGFGQQTSFTRSIEAACRLSQFYPDVILKHIPILQQKINQFYINVANKCLDENKKAKIPTNDMDYRYIYSDLQAVARLEWLIQTADSWSKVSKDEKILTQVPIVLGSSTKYGSPACLGCGSEQEEEVIHGSLKLGTDIQVVFTPRQHIRRVQDVVNKYGLQMSVVDMALLEKARQAEINLGSYLYDVFRIKKWTKPGS